MKRAFSYVRFSSKTQAGGESKRRQAEGAARWAEQNGYFLDNLTIEDLGVSAFRGRNAAEGALAAFIKAVDDRLVEKGSLLIVESLDRLSRQEVPTALELFLGILRRGVDIVTLSPSPEFFSFNKLDTTQLIIAIVIQSRAWEESAMKSFRGKDKWEQRRKRMLAGLPIGNICPKWLQVSDDGKRYILVKPQVATVKRIFKLYAEGHGTHAIAETLNTDGVSVLGHGQRWSSSQVRHVLTNRQVLGERQPRAVQDGKLILVGSPIKGFFPTVIDEDDFLKVQQRLKLKNLGKAGPRGKYITNLFTNLLISHLWDKQKEKAELVPWIIYGDADRNLTIAGPRPKASGHKKRFHLPYTVLEKALLSNLEELNVKDLVNDGQEVPDQLETAQAKLSEVSCQLEKVEMAVLQNPDVVTLAKAARQLETEERQLKSRVEELTLEVRNSQSDAVEDLQDLIRRLEKSNGEDLTKLRTKLKARLKQTIKHIVVGHIEERTNQDRTVSLAINFHHFDRLRIIELDLKRNPKGGVSVTSRTAYYEIGTGFWHKTQRA